jgi:NAD(P)-dependent dehydrogenase (short-subunit alcohol dehydrogenase family)
MASPVDTGMVFINHPTRTGSDLPFGSIKNSGYGRELSSLGIQEFVNMKLVRVASIDAPAERVSQPQQTTTTMTNKNKNTTNMEKPVWFITGCSTGFGHELARQVLELGYRTVVTARNPADVKDLAALGEALVLKLDVTDQRQISAAIKAAEKQFGRIDVLVNNAGIGYFAAVEESEEKEVRRMFDINVFGLSRMIHAVLPGMRQRRQGFIVNFSSIGGLRSFPSVGYYNATKFAVEGLSEALWQEVESLGIKVMLVEPSGFRTDWAGRSANESKQQIADYAATAGAWRKQVRAISGKQPGDPVRAAQAIVKAVASPNPPHHLLLGNDAYEGATAKLAALSKEFKAWELVARGADFPKKKSGRAA